MEGVTHAVNHCAILGGMRRRLTRIAQALLIVALVPFLVDVPPGEDASAGELLDAGAAPNARLIAVGGRSTVVAEAGRSTDPALVLVHGFGGSTFGWRAVMAPLAARGWHVVALDLPGFGLSEKSWSFDYDHESQARYVLATMDQLGLARAVFVGHSMGGNIACTYTGLRPARVARLVSLEGFGMGRAKADMAPERYERWLKELKERPAFKPYASFDAVAERLMKNNKRLPRDKADFLARHWARQTEVGEITLNFDPRHKLVNPVLSRLDELIECWKRVTCPTLWVFTNEIDPRGMHFFHIGISVRESSFFKQ